ncbi:MAG TPA: type I pullulanase, partial [Firmicutes bacterium]|nr:type I pullulanase [Bacillota bacterium]
LECQTDGGGLGFVLRKSSIKNAWLQKDGSDRWLPFYRTDERGRLSIWLLQGDPKIYYEQGDVDRTPSMTRAVIEDLNVIRVETYLPVSPALDEIWGFRLRRRSRKIRIKTVQPVGPCGHWPAHFLIKTEEPLDLEGRYHLKHKTHGYFPVSFGAVFAGAAFQEKFHYDGDDLGAAYTREATVFKVWAPTAKRMEVILYKNGEGGQGSAIPLKRGSRGVWSATLEGDLEGWFYNFLVTHGKKTSEVVDPYAKAAGVNGRRGQIVDLSKTNPEGWEQLQWLPLDNPVDAVIYEVHVRDFSSSPNSGIEAKGRYVGVVEQGTKTPRGVVTGLDHLRDLGVTHVHLLPVFDFATVDERNPLSGYNWGYDPLNYNVPEGSYASDPYDGRIRIRELKQLILGLGQAGIGTIMDVVYNHTFQSLSSSLNKLVPGYYYRLHRDGTFSNGSGCGNELADERSMVRKLIVDSAGYWAEEYKLAGFRFDLMGLHHLDTMGAIRDRVDEINPEFLIYGEGWAGGASTLNEEQRAVKRNTSRLRRVSSFCNDLRDGIKGHVFHNAEAGFIQGAGMEETVKFGMVGAVQHPQIDYGWVLYSRGPWAVEPSQCVLYAEAHDNLTLWDKLLITTPPEAEQERIAMIKLAHAIILTSQGIPFIHAGQDFARTKGGDPNSYQSPDHVNQLDWERKGEYLEVYEYTRGLIRLRKERPALRMRRGAEV